MPSFLSRKWFIHDIEIHLRNGMNIGDNLTIKFNSNEMTIGLKKVTTEFVGDSWDHLGRPTTETVRVSTCFVYPIPFISIEWRKVEQISVEIRNVYKGDFSKGSLVN